MADKVCRYETKLITGDVTFTVVDPNGERRRSEHLEELVGETIDSKDVGGEWKHDLVGHVPSEKQSAALSRLILWFEDREFFPADKQHLGATWDVDGQHIERLLRTDMTSVSGKIQAKFVDVVVHEGDRCAVIEYRGRVRGRVELGEDEEKIGTLTVGITVLRSLKNGVDVLTTGQIGIQSADTTLIGGAQADVATSATLTISSRATVEK